MREEQNPTSSPPSAQHPTPAPVVEHERWQTGRLLVAVLVCIFIIGAAMAYEALG